MVGLGIIMLGMGITLSLSQVKEALLQPERIAIGVALQFILMPLIAFALVVLTGLDPIVALGVILLGCCPGGTASNVMAFLADVDVPLSIAVTLAGTLLAPLLTPWLFWFYGEKLLGFYLGTSIDVPVLILAKAVLLVVVPVMVGVLLKLFFTLERFENSIEQGFRILSIMIIAIIVAYIVGTLDITVTGSRLMLLAVPVVLHNGIGLLSGYYVSSLMGMNVSSVRTLSLEVGMQNSGLAMAIAGILETNLLEQADPGSADLALLAVPAIIFSVWHNITGPLLASIWSGESN
jgi:BASS family bile acid:Na+ symporter